MGPPWSKRQLGVVIREATAGGVSLYYEPHCDFGAGSVAAELAPGDVDIVVTPVVNQELAAYPLVRSSFTVRRLVKKLVKPPQFGLSSNQFVTPLVNQELGVKKKRWCVDSSGQSGIIGLGTPLLRPGSVGVVMTPVVNQDLAAYLLL